MYTIEINDELISYASKFFKKAGLSDKITQLQGDAREIIPGLDMTFDLVYIDAEKDDYIEYYNLVIDKVRSGGFILADNVLWDEKVLEDPSKTDPTTRAIIEFNDLVGNDKRVVNLILPVRDGLMLIHKK